jgi:hypothetical protein
MLGLDLNKISALAADKSDTTVTMSPEVYALILNLLSMLDLNQWLFIGYGDDERELTDKALEELLP